MLGGILRPFGNPPKACPPKLGLSGVGPAPAEKEAPTTGRVGGVPCLERWKDFIFSSILFCIVVCAVRRFVAVGGGLRALFKRPSGVEEAVIDGVPSCAGVGRREGRRGAFEGSGVGLGSGDSSSSSVDSGDWGSAKSIASIDSSRGRLGAGTGAGAMVVLYNLWG